MLSPARIGAVQPGDPADLSRRNVDRLEIIPLPQHHLALLRQFQPGDEGRGPAGAPQQGTAGRMVGVRGFNGQQLCERCAVRLLTQPSQNALTACATPCIASGAGR
jgi:hypothetical protein